MSVLPQPTAPRLVWSRWERQARSLFVWLTALPPPVLADIPVIPDLEEVQEEDFVLQVAAPPRYVKYAVAGRPGTCGLIHLGAVYSGAAPSASTCVC